MLRTNVFLVALLVRCLLAAKPHEDASLKPWSAAATWGGTKPATGSNVDITEGILVDETNLDFTDITITTTGRLVFDPRISISLRAANIFVSGEMHVGSEEHPYDGDLTITLTGTRASHGSETNPKVILVKDNGILEMHGIRKRAWTKLEGTVKPLMESDDLIFDHASNPSYNSVDTMTKGIVAYTFTIDANGHPDVKQFGVYDLITSGTELAAHIDVLQLTPPQVTDNFPTWIRGGRQDAVADGEVLMMTVQRSLRKNGKDTSEENDASDALERLLYGSVTDNSILRSIASNAAVWSLVYKKGMADSLTQESTPQFQTGSEAKFQLSESLIFIASTRAGTSKAAQKADIRIVTLNGIFPLLTLSDDITTWSPGDKIVVTSTDYDYKQAEEKFIVACTSCSGTQIRIDSPFEFMHYGEILAGGALDMRAEVAMLTRNVIVQGEMLDHCPPENGNCDVKHVDGRDTFGGHMKVLANYRDVHIEDISLIDMGQQTDLGRYPMHFHMTLEPTNAQSTAYVKRCAIQNTHARCITVHCSHDVHLVDNVCYKHRGHGYFLEDGGELNTVIDGNLAISTLFGSGELEPRDSTKPASFWITSPRTIVRNNVASGGEHTGMWTLFPKQPLDPCRPFNVFEENEASRTKLTEFDNNVAHSQRMFGINVGDSLDDDRTTSPGNAWQPLSDPKDASSDPIDMEFTRLTGYKNRHRNIWIEGGTLKVIRASSSDSLNGLTLTNPKLEDDYSGTITDSVIIGESPNVGVPFSDDVGRSIPQNNKVEAPQSGLTLWKGPIKVRNVWFDSFQSNDYYDIAAVAQRRATPYFTPVSSELEDVQFAFDDDVNFGRRTMSGDVTDLGWENSQDAQLISGYTYINGGQRTYIVKPDHFSAAAADCLVRTHHRMAYCTTKYGNIQVKQSPKDQDIVFVLDQMPSAQLTFDMARNTGPLVVLDGTRSYTMHFTTQTPDEVTVVAHGMETQDVLRVGVCLPLNVTFDLRANAPYKITKTTDFIAKSSLAELMEVNVAEDGRKYYHDTTTGMLYYKFINTKDKSATEPNTCADGKCPDLKITVVSGDPTDFDCRQRLYGDDLNMAQPDLGLYDELIPADGAATPPLTWGARTTRPFDTSPPVDGGYGQWTAWITCTTECADGNQYRTRKCDSPMPEFGGAVCTGAWYEEQPCSGPCP